MTRSCCIRVIWLYLTTTSTLAFAPLSMDGTSKTNMIGWKNTYDSNLVPREMKITPISINLVPKKEMSMSSTRLGESRGDSLMEKSSNSQVDYEALLKYHAAIAIQCTIIAVVFLGIDTIVDTMGISDSIPSWATIPFFYGISLKSRVFNPLNNARPSLIDAVQSDGPMASSPTAPGRRGFGDRVMPSWTPPGPVFPIMWLLVIGPLRAYSTSLVWETNGHHAFDPAIMTLIFHLAVGDVWNTMNNTERRYGAAVTGVLCVTASALLAAYRYTMVDSTAGHLLGLPMIWFAVASSLVAATWQLNPIDDKSPSKTLDPLYPVVGEISTKFLWEK